RKAAAAPRPVLERMGPAGASRHPTLFLRLTSDQVGIPLNLSISISGGKETNRDCLS
ncbi:hypothetical protein P174DRAFT_479562, partial [Aspergillus novofumigatus IBT 16806]